MQKMCNTTYWITIELDNLAELLTDPWEPYYNTEEWHEFLMEDAHAGPIQNLKTAIRMMKNIQNNYSYPSDDIFLHWSYLMHIITIINFSLNPWHVYVYPNLRKELIHWLNIHAEIVAITKKVSPSKFDEFANKYPLALYVNPLVYKLLIN